jgi:hypothetical protein
MLVHARLSATLNLAATITGREKTRPALTARRSGAARCFRDARWVPKRIGKFRKTSRSARKIKSDMPTVIIVIKKMIPIYIRCVKKVT